MTAQTYRVVQWATGNIGTKALRGVIEHPLLELVGLVVHSAEKVGRDAGELCGLTPTGVAATTSLDEVLALKPDCVLYMPQVADVDAVCALLSAGTDVVTTCGVLSGDLSGLPEADRERVLAACTSGGSSLHATGSSPGFATEVIPLAVMSIQRRVDLVEIEEFADVSHRDSPQMLFDIMGFGQQPESFGPERAQHLLGAFRPSLQGIGEAAGVTLDHWTCAGETATTPVDLTISAGVVPAGTVAAQRTRLVGHVGDRPLITFTASWYVSTAIDPAWDLGATGWRLRVTGDAPLVLEMPFPVTDEQMASVTPGYTANRAVNVVPWICSAAAGVVRTADLPAITPVGPRI
jgi:hypothetical protein